MIVTHENKPEAVASGGPGAGRWEASSVLQHSTAVTRQLAEVIGVWIEGWDDCAQRFLSGFFRDAFEGHRIAVDLGLRRCDFPRNELWLCAEILGLCACAEIQRPSLQAIIDHADDSGVALCGSNDADLNWLRDLEGSAAGCAAYAKALKRYARRKALIQRCYQRMCNLLGNDGYLVTEQPEIVTRIRRQKRRQQWR